MGECGSYRQGQPQQPLCVELEMLAMVTGLIREMAIHEDLIVRHFLFINL